MNYHINVSLGMNAAEFRLVGVIQTQILGHMAIVFGVDGVSCVDFHWTLWKMTDWPLICHPRPGDWEAAVNAIATRLFGI